MGPSLLDSASKLPEKRSGEFEMPLAGPDSVTVAFSMATKHHH